MKTNFIPVLLGSDINVYGMAIQFYEEYNIVSIGVCKTILKVCRNTKLINFEIVNKDIENDDIFVKCLKELKNKYKNKKLLLVPCGDNYLELVVRNQKKLEKDFYFNVVDDKLFNKICTKEKFYKSCEENNLNYPKTIICDKSSWKNQDINLNYPIIVKASNSPMFWNCSFKNKKKVFIAQSSEEKDAIINAIFNSGYDDSIICQEFIPGDDSYMRVVNAYVGKDSKVKYISSGKILLEECTPEGIGSYSAIINEYNEELCDLVKNYLEKIKYKGFANFDIKYNQLTGEYNFFEINMRQGRSSFYVFASGHNFAKNLVDDVVYQKNIKFKKVTKKSLYSIIPNYIIFKYVSSKELKKEARNLIKDNLKFNSYYYKKDKNLKRYINFLLNQINYLNKYHKYFNNKGKYEK